MSKSLAESAAEILKASMGSAGKEPGASLGSAQDLGGQTVDTKPEDVGAGVGTKSASTVNKAAEPTAAGKQEPSAAKPANAEVVADSQDGIDAVKKLTSEETESVDEEVELTEEEIDAYLDSLTEEELAELAEQALEEDAIEEAQLKLPAGVKVKKTPGHPGDDESEHTVTHNGKELGHITKSWDGNHSAVHYSAGPHHSEVDQTDHDDHRSAVKAILKTHGLSKAKEELEEQGMTGLSLPLNKTKAPYPKKPEGVGIAPVVPGAKMPGKTVKEMVEENMGSCMEDVNALFNGESLSEEFRGKATTIFEAAVKSRVSAIVEQIVAKNEDTIAEEVDGIRADLAEKVDTYLNYVVEEWMSENTIAVDSGLRSEIAEDFIHGLKGLFEQHYIEIPEEKIQVAEELAEQVVTLEQKLEESAEAIASIQKSLNESLKNESVRKICEGLTEVQIGKMKSLAEGVEFTTEGEYNEKLAVIRENYFPTKTVKVEKIAETASDNSEVADVSGVMDYYVKAITKSLPK